MGLLRGQGSLGELESVHKDKNLQDWDMEPSCTETANKTKKKKKKREGLYFNEELELFIYLLFFFFGEIRIGTVRTE